MPRRRRRIVLATSALALLAAMLLGGFLLGCFGGRRMMTHVGPLVVDAPHLIHVVGWRGPVAGDRDFLLALRSGGCPHTMETFDWTDGRDGIMALRYAQRSTVPAERLAARIASLARDGRPIDLTADSSGCGVLLAALARLPDGVRVRNVFLSSPAVSGGYDLGPALARVDGELFSFRSRRDGFILGLGTTLFGTVDGRHESAAGRYGFHATDAKLRQIDYDPAWSARYGHGGGHAEMLGSRFGRGYVAPLLLAEPPLRGR